MYIAAPTDATTRDLDELRGRQQEDHVEAFGPGEEAERVAHGGREGVPARLCCLGASPSLSEAADAPVPLSWTRRTPRRWRAEKPSPASAAVDVGGHQPDIVLKNTNAVSKHDRQA